MSVLTSLQTAKANMAARLAELDASEDAKKVTHSVDGQSMSWAEYRASLIQAINDINDLLAKEGDENYGPFEEVQRGVT